MPAAAQCRVTGSARIGHAVARGHIDLSRVELPDIEIRLESGRIEGRLRSPIEAPLEVSEVPFRVAAGARIGTGFLEGATEGIGVLLIEGGLVLELDGLRIDGISVPCEALALGAPSTFHRVTGVERLGTYAVGDGLVLHARPDRSSASVRVTDLDPAVPFEVVARRGRWAQLALGFEEGARVVGWARWDPTRADRLGSGRGGFRGSIDPIPIISPLTPGCYQGPARFRPRAALFESETSEVVWAYVTHDAMLAVRDCGGARVELVRVLGVEASWGWMDRSEVEQVGVLRCEADAIELVQDRETWRITVGATGTALLEVADEVVRIGDRAIVGPPFETVTPTALEELCAAWERGARWGVLRNGERIDVSRL